MIGVKYVFDIKIKFKDSKGQEGSTYGKMYADNESELEPQAIAILEDSDSIQVLGLDPELKYSFEGLEVHSSKEQV